MHNKKQDKMPEEALDYYFDNSGLMVFKEQYHLDRGYCCGNGCRHCPYEHINVPSNIKQQINLQNDAAKKAG